MAIGTTAAILGAAAIGGGTALASGAMQSRAADRSAQAVQSATDQSSATQRYIFDQARADNRVRQQTGDAASLMMAQLMGLNLGPQQGQPQPAMQQSYPTGQPGGSATYGGAGADSSNALMNFGTNDMAMVVDGQEGPMRPNGNALMGYQAPQAMTQPGQPQVLPAQGGAATTANALNPTDWLRSTPGYQFNFDEGARALNTRLAGQGRLQSGDASREAIRYGQNYGDRIYADQYNRLGALAGAGQVASSANQQAGANYANNQTSLNMNNANARASSYQNGANAWTNALGGVAGAATWGLGQFGGMK